MESDHERDRRDPGLDEKLEEELLGDAPKQQAKQKPGHVVLSVEDWDNMKAQNVAILKELKDLRKQQKRTRCTSKNGHDTCHEVHSDVDEDLDLEMQPQKKKKVSGHNVCLETLSDEEDIPRKKKKKRAREHDTCHKAKNQTNDNMAKKIALEESDLEAEVEALMNASVNVSVGDVSHNSNTDGESDLDEFLEGIEQEYELESDTGPAVHEKLARVLTKMAQGKMDTDTLQRKLEKQKRPENCGGLVVPRVNPEIWNVLDHTTRTQDLKSQKVQRNIMKATIAMVNVADVCIKSSNTDLKAVLKDTTDAIGINLKTVHDISIDRRVKILNAPNLNPKYKKLASEEIPITTFLFGDELRTVLSQIDTTSKLGINLTTVAHSQSGRGRKYHPQSKNGGLSWSERRGRGRGSPMRWGQPMNPFPRGTMTRGRGYKPRGRWQQRNVPNMYQNQY